MCLIVSFAYARFLHHLNTSPIGCHVGLFLCSFARKPRSICRPPCDDRYHGHVLPDRAYRPSGTVLLDWDACFTKGVRPCWGTVDTSLSQLASGNLKEKIDIVFSA